MSFKPDAGIRAAVEQGDSRKVRIIILDMMIMRAPQTEDIRAQVDWIKSHQHPEGSILHNRTDYTFPHIQDKNKWTYDYFQDQVADANDDFSFDRLRHILEVRQHLRDSGHSRLTPLYPAVAPAGTGSHNARSEASHKPHPSGQNSAKGQGAQRFPTGKTVAIAAGIGIAATAAFLSSRPLIGFGIAAIGAAYLYHAARQATRS